MDDATDQAFEAYVANRSGDPSARPHDEVLPVLFYGAFVIWAVSVAVNAWYVWTQGGEFGLQGSSTSTQLQLLVTTIGSTWDTCSSRLSPIAHQSCCAHETDEITDSRATLW